MIRALKHAYIRRRAKLSALPTARFSIRLAKSTDDYLSAFNLVQVSYAYLGIGELGTSLLRMTEQHLLPESFVLIAEEQGQVVGTITVAFDSPGGLPLDKDYPEVLATLRRQEGSIAEIGSFAVVQRCRNSGVALLLGLAASRLIWSQGCSHTVIGIHPKAAPVYEAIWGYRSSGDAQSHASLSAPVAGLVVSRAEQKDHAHSHLGSHRLSARTLEDLMFGAAPIPNTKLPPKIADSEKAGRRPRMSRETFQKLFLEHSDHVSEVSPRTLAHARKHRSDQTLGLEQSLRNSTIRQLGANDVLPEESGLTWLH